MQVYQGLDIGTAKAAKEEREAVRHHGLDITTPVEYFSADRYSKIVEPVLEHAWQQKKPLILCGGTGLYFRALLEGFFQTPDPDEAFRECCDKKVHKEGKGTLYQELQVQDPETALSIHPNDTVRVIRALEIIHLTGEKVSVLKKKQKKKPWMQHTVFVGLYRSQAQLLPRIKKRARWMYENGLIEESEQLIQMGCNVSYAVRHSLGYQECIDYLQGKTTKEKAVEDTVQNTIHYAKQQKTWFNGQCNPVWIDMEDGKDFKEIVNKSLQVWELCANYDTIG